MIKFISKDNTVEHGVVGNVLVIDPITNVERNEIIPENGMFICNSTSNNAQLYTGGNWLDLSVGLTQFIDVRNYNVLGDGITDNTLNIQTALNFASTSSIKWVFFPEGDYLISNTLNIPYGVNIVGYGAKIFNNTSHIYILNLYGNNIIKGVEIEGFGSSTPNLLARGINIVGLVNDYKSNILIQDVYVHDLGFYGIYIQFVKNVDIQNCRVYNSGYSGIMVLSGINIHGRYNHIKGITGVSSEGYCVSFTRGSTTLNDNLIDNPRSFDCSFSYSLIEDNIVWKGLDVHSSESITFDNNIIKNCAIPIGIVSGNSLFAPKNCKVLNNTLQSGLGLNAGLLLAGAFNSLDLSSSIESAENCQVIGNTFIECGITNNAFSGAIRMRDTKNTIIIGNHFKNSKVNDIGVLNTNFNFCIQSNTFENVNAPTVTLAHGINVTDPHNSGLIGGNTFERNNPSLNTNVGDRMIRLNSSHINDIKITLLGDRNNGFLSEVVEDGPFIIRSFTNTGGTIKGSVILSTTQSSGSEQLRFNNVYRFWADNVGPGSANNRLWLSGPANGAIYLGVRSSTPLHLIDIGATNINLNGKINNNGDLTVNGDLDALDGVILTAPNLTKYKISVDNSGNLLTTIVV